MNLKAWQGEWDRIRFRRMLAGLGVGTISLGGIVTFLVLSSTGAQAIEEDDVMDLQLPEEPEEKKEVEPEQREEPEPAPIEDVVQTPGPRLEVLRPPEEISDEKPEEKNPAPPGQGGEEDPYARTGGRGSSGTGAARTVVPPTAGPARPPPRPAVPAKRKGPSRVTEKMTPPTAISTPSPPYPPALKAQGIEGTVVVKYLVGDDGTVKAAKVLSGPEPLRGGCLASLRGWRFKPALDENGKPVSVVRVRSFVFTITVQ